MMRRQAWTVFEISNNCCDAFIFTIMRKTGNTNGICNVQVLCNSGNVSNKRFFIQLYDGPVGYTKNSDDVCKIGKEIKN